MARKDFYVYRYTCPIRNQVIYIGKGTRKRAYAHLRRRDMHPFVQRIQWICKQGEQPIIDFVCKGVDEELAFLVEIEAISKYKRKDISGGTLLNLTDGGEGASGTIVSPEVAKARGAKNKGKKRTEEVRQRMRAIQNEPERKLKKSLRHTGRQVTEEFRAKMSDLMKNHVRSDDHKAKLAVILKERGKKERSEEYKRQVSERMKDIWAKRKEQKNA